MAFPYPWKNVYRRSCHTMLFHPPQCWHVQLLLYQYLGQASVVDYHTQFCHQFVSVCKVISCSSGVPINDRIYPVIPDPHQFPDVYIIFTIFLCSFHRVLLLARSLSLFLVLAKPFCICCCLLMPSGIQPHHQQWAKWAQTMPDVLFRP